MRYLYQLPFQLALQLIVGLLLSSSIYWTAAAADSEAVTNADATIVIGSKNFGESYLLSEIAAQVLERQGFAVERRFGLGGTLICFDALRNDEIDFYIEYTGTLSQAVLKMPGRPTREDINAELRTLDLQMLSEIGFNNTYAVAVRESQAQELNLSTISDLAAYPNLPFAFSHEFLQRGDGWPGLSKLYNLNHKVEGIEHGLAYQAIADGAIDATDAYSTDGELLRYNLRVLEDSKSYFPAYRAAPLARSNLSLDVRTALAPLKNLIDDAQMQWLNAEVVVQGKSFQDVANEFITGKSKELGLAKSAYRSVSWQQELWGHFLRHIQLTGAALFSAIIVGIGLSLLIYSNAAVANAVVYTCGLMQTVPSLALLALMIPIFGIGVLPAIIALFLYSLLPIVRNAVTALSGVDLTLVRVSRALGLTHWEQLRFLRLPLSMPAIFAGIRTAAVISIGTATLAAFIGAGGLGEPIVVGLSLNDTDMILRGAIPAALLAILTEFCFEILQRKIVRRTT
jgi:osmoprotectant transport system permease protein